LARNLRSLSRRLTENQPIARPPDEKPGSPVLVVGLGRFGSAIAQTLTSLGHEVLGVDCDEEVVQAHADVLTHVVAANCANSVSLKQLGVEEFTHAVVGMGNIEASILTCVALVDLGVENIWAKAISDAHGRILDRVGAHHVVYPESDMGERVAHLVTGRMMEYIQLDEDFALVETRAPRELIGKTLGEAGVRGRFGVTVVCVKPKGQTFTYATPDTLIDEDDLLLVAGSKEHAEKFGYVT
jgi:trk system potassium uptake protein TrkA